MAILPDEMEDHEQELITPQVTETALDSRTLATLQKSEIDQQIATAKRYPRSMTKLMSTAGQLVTADVETADEMIYALPRGGKVIEGPSVRFAEVLAYSWGNSRCGARVTEESEEFVTAQGSFFDLEQNVQIGYEVKRRITDKNGKRFNTDMIATTANAACSIALRNAILRGIPKAIWRKLYAQARQVVAGDIKTLDARRVMMLKSFELMGVKREQILTKLNIKGVEDISLDHLVTLRGVYNAIREESMSAQQAFAPEPSDDRKLAEKSRENLEKIKEKYAQPATIAETDPEKAEQLRKEAERQKAAVAEKYGASQPPTTESAPPSAQEAVPAAAAEPPAAPTEQQGVRDVSTDIPTGHPAEPEGGLTQPPSEPELSEEELAEHGVANIFDPPKGKSNRKR